MHTNNYYDILGVNKKATLQEIKRAYKKWVIKLHPDKNMGSTAYEELLKELNQVYYILSDTLRRKEYDKSIFSEISEEQIEAAPKTESIRGRRYENIIGIINEVVHKMMTHAIIGRLVGIALFFIGIFTIGYLCELAGLANKEPIIQVVERDTTPPSKRVYPLTLGRHH